MEKLSLIITILIKYKIENLPKNLDIMACNYKVGQRLFRKYREIKFTEIYFYQ